MILIFQRVGNKPKNGDDLFFPELVEGTVCRKPHPARATLYWDPEVTSSAASQ
jgi:hypothetical protein